MLRICEKTLQLVNEDNDTFESYMEKVYGLRIQKSSRVSPEGISPSNVSKQRHFVTIIDLKNKQFIYPDFQQIVPYGGNNNDDD